MVSVGYCLLITSAVAGFAYGQPDLPSFRSMGGLGPYISMDSLGVDPNVPEGCTVNQAIFLCRHGERYPQSWEYYDLADTLKKVQGAGGLRGPLEFLTNYTMFMTEEQKDLETSTGPYNGHYEAKELGKKLRAQYGHLLPKNEDDKKFNIFTADQERVQDTANHFTEGFFGTNWTNLANMITLPEYGDPMNTLTPENQCSEHFFNMSGNYADQAIAFRQNTFHPILKRIQQYSKAELNVSDVYNLMDFCPYEINAIGGSKFCSIFTEDEWKSFDYFNGLNMYYGWGAGQKGGVIAAGSLYTNSTMSVLKEGPQAMGGLILNFAHDSDIIQALGALNLFVPENGMPFDRRDDGTVFQISQIIPMLAHLTLERITCAHDTFVRVNLNDQYIPLPGCQSGPGKSCPLGDYEEYVLKYHEDYEDKCGLREGQSKYTTLYWDHKNV
ncbi:hypothetical protein TRICI_005408 [Trichomonascus ciferrii]|uniref:Uncharacterized protein n=1 Tax=Trichomonascus ciferrii TaxID=44093 RepID=A0A642USE5_9ASCO|nr:hypothetical protein TRICI_005408 [Trichomonascus ciferrii]